MRTRAIIGISIITLIIIGVIIVFWQRNKQPKPTVTHFKTTIIQYTPTDITGVATEQGSCWTNSIAIPYRSDTWRCMVDNAISDPCFSIPNNSTEVLCNPDPLNSNKQKPFLISLTAPLPLGNAPASPTAPWGWLIQLADGTICTPFTGTRTILADGTPTTYGCNNPIENTIFDDLTDNGNGTWSATVGTISSPKNPNDLPIVLTSKQVLVKTVWQ